MLVAANLAIPPGNKAAHIDTILLLRADVSGENTAADREDPTLLLQI
jgi:hypothetical protein